MTLRVAIVKICLWIGLVGVVCFAQSCKSQNEQSEQVKPSRSVKPNIVLIFADDLDFDEISTYREHSDPSLHDLPSHTGAAERNLEHKTPQGYTLGYSNLQENIIQTPTLDKLSADGATFKRMYVTSAVCTPSRYSLLTGKYASRSKFLREKLAVNPALDNNLFIDFNTPLDNEIMVTHRLKSAGYTTGLSGKWHTFENMNDFISRFPGDPDPASPDVAAKLEANYQKAVDYLKSNAGFDYVGSLYVSNANAYGLPKKLIPGHKHNLEWTIAGANKFIDENHETPFFLYVPLTTPHGWLGQIGPTENAKLTPRGVLDEIPDSGMPPRETIPKRLGKPSRAEMALWIDDGLKSILQRLDQYELSENTIVIFISDHTNRGKETTYEASRVPAIIRWPANVSGGQVIEALAANIDIAPTILDAAGAVDINGMDGKSLKGILTGQSNPVRNELLLEIGASKAVVTPDWKYIANRAPLEIKNRMANEKDLPELEKKHGWMSSAWLYTPLGTFKEARKMNYNNHRFFPAFFDEDQLYNLNDDPYEQTNLFNDPAQQKRAADMQTRLSEFMRETDQVFGEFE